MNGWVAAALVTSVLQEPAVPPSPSPPADLSICDVLANWRDHHQKTVRVEGYYRGGFERSSLSGPGCSGERVWVKWPDEPQDGEAEALKKKMRGAGRFTGIRVVVEGVFHGPAPRANGTAARYGHLGGYAALLQLKTVHAVGEK